MTKKVELVCLKMEPLEAGSIDTTSLRLEAISNTNDLPLNIVPLDNQVAGHSFKDGKFMIGMLKHNDGYVLKPVNRPEQGKREISFYESFQTTTEPIFLRFKEFIPDFKGTTNLLINGKNVTFLKLNNITVNFIHPCVMDIKVGAQTWEPGASQKKRDAEDKKYADCKKELSFCIPGFQVFRVTTGTVEKFGKDYGRQLTKYTVPGAMKKFLNTEVEGSRCIVSQILQRLYKMREWWRTQQLIHIYSSSILVSYDAQYLINLQAGDNYGMQIETYLNANNYVQVALIDFAHCVPAHCQVDTNYLSGLENVVKMFEEILAQL